MSWPRQAFRLSRDIVTSVSREEVRATIRDMEEMNLYRPPYDELDIMLNVETLFEVFGGSPDADYDHNMQMMFRYFNLSGRDYILRCLVEEFPGKWKDMTIWLNEGRYDRGLDAREYGANMIVVGKSMLDILIVLLATKNVVKETKECKLLKLGIGTKNRHQYTTTLKIGTVTERTGTVSGIESPYTERRPHLRRGHIRRQHYGPGNEFLKKVWIEPVFVNADPAWIAERTAYNVSKKKEKV